ncbi:hypothetical protein N7G274_006621 [Stereocaulon virgatum]|uniref:NADPH-dependent FMN reductase-like domain-containing protein n=1 Tax=Stereocaulon virgatum TaxID=373712 RepID=A0ABR4A409_9LECA
MVTGVETADLILVALPIYIEALSVFKSGLDKTARVPGFKQKNEIKDRKTPKATSNPESVLAHQSIQIDWASGTERRWHEAIRDL